jgi:hypothetical protein
MSDVYDLDMNDVRRWIVWTQAERVKKQKGYHKNYLNGLRGVGCKKTQCSLCREGPSSKSLKKSKGKRNKGRDREYLETSIDYWV